jgi:hypothetical protein
MPGRQRSGRQGGSGRINPHDRQTDDITPTFTGPGISEEHAAAIFTTANQGLSKKVRTEHRSRIRRFINFLFEQYPLIYEECTIIVSQEERADLTKYYTDKDIRDLVYSGLDPQYFLAFLSQMRIKDNGKHSSVSNISKFYDALKFGSKISKRLMSVHFYSEVDQFIACYKREHASAKKNGQTDEMEADAISSTLFKLLLTWAVEEGNVFVWCFSLLMWHLMARSINVDCLSLHNLKRGISDSIVFKYDETKMDKTGEFVQEKNVYSNPLKGQEHLCVFTALGCYLSLYSEQLEGTEKIFIRPGSQYRTAAQSFALQIGEIAKAF